MEDNAIRKRHNSSFTIFCVVYDWREFGLLVCPICLHKSLRLPTDLPVDVE